MSGSKLSACLPLLVGILLPVILLLGQYYSSIFEYRRWAITEGEYWRLVTCHFTHLDWRHLLLNLAGFSAVIVIFRGFYSPLGWLVGATASAFAVGFSLLLFAPGVDWYVGSSGVLHGLVAMGLIGGLKLNQGSVFCALGLLALTAKLMVECFAGPAGQTGRLLNANIISEAHLAGALGGVIIGLLITGLKGPVARRARKLAIRSRSRALGVHAKNPSI